MEQEIKEFMHKVRKAIIDNYMYYSDESSGCDNDYDLKIYEQAMIACDCIYHDIFGTYLSNDELFDDSAAEQKWQETLAEHQRKVNKGMIIDGYNTYIEKFVEQEDDRIDINDKLLNVIEDVAEKLSDIKFSKVDVRIIQYSIEIHMHYYDVEEYFMQTGRDYFDNPIVECYVRECTCSEDEVVHRLCTIEDFIKDVKQRQDEEVSD